MADLRPDGSFPYVRVTSFDPLLADLPVEVAGLIQDARYGDFNGDGVVTLTYSFVDTSNETFSPPSLALRARIQTVLEEISRLVNIKFVEVDQDGAIDFSVEAGLSERGFAGFAEFPWVAGSSARVDDGAAPTDAILIQEILHTLGLQGSEEDFLALPNLDYPRVFDTPLWSNLQTEAFSLTDRDSTGLLPFDIEGLIALYGDSGETAGDDIYRYDTSIFAFEGLHDAGGNDTLIITSPDATSVRVNLSGRRGAIDLGQSAQFRSSTEESFETIGNLVNTTRQTSIENVRTAGGDDTVIGGLVANDIKTGSGADFIDGLGGKDTLHGQGGDDTVEGGNGDDLLFGNAGQDLLSGETGNDSLIGGDGNDSLYGGVGRDSLIGQKGADLIDGAGAIDSASYGQSTAGIFIDLSAGVARGGDAEGDTLIAIEDIDATNFDDTLSGTNDRNRLNARNGDDGIEGHGGDDLLFGGGGRDTIFGGGGDDLINGQGGDDTLFGEAGDDVIIGNQGDDLINGGNGNDSLTGNAGRDTLLGGAGDDTLSGQQSADTFVYERGNDVVADFRFRQGDTLDLSRVGFATIADALDLARDTELGVVFDFGEAGTLTVLNVTVSDFTD